MNYPLTVRQAAAELGISRQAVEKRLPTLRACGLASGEGKNLRLADPLTLATHWIETCMRGPQRERMEERRFELAFGALLGWLEETFPGGHLLLAEDVREADPLFLGVRLADGTEIEWAKAMEMMEAVAS